MSRVIIGVVPWPTCGGGSSGASITRLGAALAGRCHGRRVACVIRIPVPSRRRAVLEMARHTPDGEPMPPATYAFGNELGERVGDTKRAWQATVLRSSGDKPAWIWRRECRPNEKGTTQLSKEPRAAYRAVDLPFHDPRHNRHRAGSRLLEAGWPVHCTAPGFLDTSLRSRGRRQGVP
jgi:hypothetical protein